MPASSTASIKGKSEQVSPLQPSQSAVERSVDTAKQIFPEFLWEHLGGMNPKEPLCDVRQVYVTLPDDGPLGQKGQSIAMPLDEMLLPGVLKNKSWQLKTSRFLAQQSSQCGTCNFLDIGANAGLITRQLLVESALVKKAFCVEPDPVNYACLVQNLAGYDNVKLINAGLAETNGMLCFYRERKNSGNYSFNASAVSGHEHTVVEARALAVDSFFEQIAGQLTEGPILWKSDTQGYDELIVSKTPEHIWHRLQCAVIEIWRIEKPEFDAVEFCRRVDSFANKQLGDQMIASSDEVMAYLASTDRQHTDLLLWR